MSFSNLKKLLNSIKCPICNSQIDTLFKVNNPIYKGFGYSCVVDYNHYAIKIIENYFVYISEEIVNLRDEKHNYCILQSKFDTEIAIEEIDEEGRIQFAFSIPKIKKDLSLFDFQNFNYEKAINRIKMMLVFQ